MRHLVSPALVGALTILLVLLFTFPVGAPASDIAGLHAVGC